MLITTYKCKIYNGRIEMISFVVKEIRQLCILYSH